MADQKARTEDEKQALKQKQESLAEEQTQEVERLMQEAEKEAGEAEELNQAVRAAEDVRSSDRLQPVAAETGVTPKERMQAILKPFLSDQLIEAQLTSPDERRTFNAVTDRIYDAFIQELKAKVDRGEMLAVPEAGGPLAEELREQILRQVKAYAEKRRAA